MRHTQTNTTVHPVIQGLENILSKEIPNKQDFNQFEKLLLKIQNDNTGFLLAEFNNIREQYPSVSTEVTMQGLSFKKKYGYAGDFEIIDKMYTGWKSKEARFRVWDEYFYTQGATQAVRNRKSYFKTLLKNLLREKPTGEIRVLNLASGSCRDLLEFFEETDQQRVKFDCVEIDSHAILYAANLLGDYGQNVNFIHKNIFRFIPEKEYDLIWSAGLFDYFDDPTFIKLLRRLLNSQQERTEFVIGNFSDKNPTIPYMEIIGEWFLHHRGRNLLESIALEAGALATEIGIKHEAEEINLFLHISR